MFRFQQKQRTPRASSPLLTPKILYDLAGQCQTFANDLARHDPHKVDLEMCHRYNDWLSTLRSYEMLTRRIVLRTARPIARWQLITLGAVIWFFLNIALPNRLDRIYSSAFVSSWLLGLIILYFIPQQFYGTTVELLEAQLLLLVDALLELSQNGEIQLTEAVFFRVKEILESTRHELRQQLDLAHRNDRSYL